MAHGVDTLLGAKWRRAGVMAYKASSWIRVGVGVGVGVGVAINAVSKQLHPEWRSDINAQTLCQEASHSDTLTAGANA